LARRARASAIFFDSGALIDDKPAWPKNPGQSQRRVCLFNVVSEDDSPALHRRVLPSCSDGLAFGIGPGFFGHGGLVVDQGAAVKKNGGGASHGAPTWPSRFDMYPDWLRRDGRGHRDAHVGRRRMALIFTDVVAADSARGARASHALRYWHEHRPHAGEGSAVLVTRERIRQIEAKALRKLKHLSRSRKLRSFLDN